MLYVALFLLWPFLEIAMFGRMSSAFGAAPVFLACISSAIAGGLIIQHQGFKTMTTLRQSVQQGARGGQMPATEIFNGFCYFVAGVLLIIPGFISDFAAFLLLIPEFQAILRRRIAPGIVNATEQARNPAANPDYIIDGEFTRVDDHAKPMFQTDTEIRNDKT